MNLHDNPWIDLPRTPPFVLACDRPYVDQWNKGRTPSDAAWLNTSRMPEPRSGPRNAMILVLQANPSYDDTRGDLADDEVERLHASLVDDSTPHVGLLDQHPWWRRAFGTLLKEVPPGDLAHRVCSVEFFPYPSRAFAHAHLRLPSQTYQFRIVREALARDATIVVTRGLNYWLGAIPELGAQLDETVFETNSARRAYVSPGNLPSKAYARIRERLVAASP